MKISATMPPMRFLLPILLVTAAAAQSRPQIQTSHTTESLRGVSAVSSKIAWASATHGTYLRTTDGGHTWMPTQVQDAASLDFRGVVAFSTDEAFLMSSGPGEQSRIYHTFDAGQHWILQFTNSNPKGFFDSIAFWDPKHGVVLGDPIPDEHGKLKFEVLLTDDGQTWHQLPPSQLPEALEGEGAFAASNTCIAILRSASAQPTSSDHGQSPTSVILSGVDAAKERPRGRRIPTLSTGFASQEVLFSATLRQETGTSMTVEERRFGAASDAPTNGVSAPDPNIWFATGSKTARVFHSPDHGKTWEVFNTPILHGPESAGIFSIAFRDAQHGVIAGGDYKHPRDDGPNLAFTEDGGKTWKLSDVRPQAYFSAVAYDRAVNEAAEKQTNEQRAAEAAGRKIRVKPSSPQRLFIIAQDFILDFRPPTNPRRISGKKEQGFDFNAVSAYPGGGALIVGPKGVIALIP